LKSKKEWTASAAIAVYIAAPMQTEKEFCRRSQSFPVRNRNQARQASRISIPAMPVSTRSCAQSLWA